MACTSVPAVHPRTAVLASSHTGTPGGWRCGCRAKQRPPYQGAGRALSVVDDVIDSDGGAEPTNLTGSPENDDTPDWSPDGRWIVWETEAADGTHDIERMRRTGGSRLPVTDTPGVNDFWPAWSPDGATIAFDRARTLDRDRYKVARDIWSIPVDGGRSERLTDGSDTNVGPVWRSDD